MSERFSTVVNVRLPNGTPQDEARVRARIADDARVCFGLEATETASGGVEVEGDENALSAFLMHVLGPQVALNQREAG